MQVVARALALLVVLACLSPFSALAAEVPLTRHQGRDYVTLDSLATALRAKTTWTAGSARVRLSVGKQVVEMTRNAQQVLVNGKRLKLSAPVVVAAGKWLVPEEFLATVVPKIAPGTRIVASRPAPPPRAVVARAPKQASAIASVASPPDESIREATLVDMRVRSYPSFTRVVIEADAPFGHQTEKNGTEVRVRLGGLDVDEPRVEEVNDGLVRRIRIESIRGDAIARVTLEAGGEVRATTLADPFRLVLDFSRAVELRESRLGGPALRHIVLDAGHGGHDAGALGPTGLMEKDVVLDVTRRVARLVEERLGIKVSLSRDGDYFVPLRDRTSFANREHADLFVSIHANAHRESASAGVETYFLSLEATDNAARQVAERENDVVNLEAPVARAQMDVLRTILWDLAQSAYLEESSNLAEVLQDAITDSLHIGNRGVKQAGFYVLGGAAMPAVLIEIGFVTNPREERRLRDGRYRDEIARAIFAGISAYKRRYDQRMRAGVEAAGVGR